MNFPRKKENKQDISLSFSHHQCPSPPLPTSPTSNYIELVVNTRPGETHVRESTRVLGQRVRRKTEEVFDHATGKTVLRTLEFTEKEIEYEVVAIQS